MRITVINNLWSPAVRLLMLSLPALLIHSCTSRDRSKQEAVSVWKAGMQAPDTIGGRPVITAHSAPTDANTKEVIPLTWEMLATTDFEERYNEELKAMIPYPIFSDELKKLEGQTVQIKGYVIPVDEFDEEGGLLVLSAVPNSQCFFCGEAGPESVMDVQLKEDLGRFDNWMDRQLTFRGRLRLNEADLYQLNFILEEARQVKK